MTRKFWRALLLAPVVAALASMGANLAMADCPKIGIPPATANRGNIHTQVVDIGTNQLRSIYKIRQYSKTGTLFMMIGVSANCPNQGCAVDTTNQMSDCTATYTNELPLFYWNLGTDSTNADLPSLGETVTLKEPSGTLVFGQSSVAQTVNGVSCPHSNVTSGLTVVTEVYNKDTNVGYYVKYVRIYVKQHPGSTNNDFYMVIGVNSSHTFTPDGPQTDDCTTTTDNANGWYDMYWSVVNGSGGTINTKSEAIEHTTDGIWELYQRS